jgi:hypothetical protein
MHKIMIFNITNKYFLLIDFEINDLKLIGSYFSEGKAFDQINQIFLDLENRIEL